MKKNLILLVALLISLPINGIVNAASEESEVKNSATVEKSVGEETKTVEVELTEAILNQGIETETLEEPVTIEEQELVTTEVDEPVIEKVIEENIATEIDSTSVEDQITSNYNINGQERACGYICTYILTNKTEWHITMDEAKLFTPEYAVSNASIAAYFQRICPDPNSDCTTFGSLDTEFKNPEIFDEINKGEVGEFDLHFGYAPTVIQNYVHPSSPFIVKGDSYRILKVYVHAPFVLPELPGIGYVNGVDIASIEEGTEISDEVLKSVFNIDSNESIDVDREILIEHEVIDTSIVGEYDVSFLIGLGISVSMNKLEDVHEAKLVITDVIPTIEYTSGIEVELGANIDDHISDLNINAFDSAIEDLTSEVVIDTSAVDTSEVGTYPITLSVTDNEGNLVSEEADVIITAPEVVEPEVVEPEVVEPEVVEPEVVEPEVVEPEVVEPEVVEPKVVEPTLTKTGGQAWFFQFVLLLAGLLLTKKVYNKSK